MTSNVTTFSAIARHVYTEPKFVAQVQWMQQHASLSTQIEQAVGRDAMAQYARTGQWPEQTHLTLSEPPEEPDWDWWEPRHDQPWRRQQARDRAT